jgi:hypothetical protein
MGDAHCVLCQGPGDIQISAEVIFYVCGRDECLKKLPDYITSPNGWIDDSTHVIEVMVGTKRKELPNDKRVLRGIGTKIREMLNGHS